MLYGDERKRWPLGTPEAVTVLVISESVLVIWVFEKPLAGLGDHHLLTATVAHRQVAGGEVSGVGQCHL